MVIEVTQVRSRHEQCSYTVKIQAMVLVWTLAHTSIAALAEDHAAKAICMVGALYEAKIEENKKLPVVKKQTRGFWLEWPVLYQ